jgi:hypothetical protein
MAVNVRGATSPFATVSLEISGDMVPGVAAAAGGLLDPAGQMDRWEAAMRRAASR